jgi:RNA polymerase sigma factor (sigma-70 family)
MDRAMEGATEFAGINDRPRGARPRPPAKQLFAAAVDLIAGGGSNFKATARRYSICAADAEDAYQRGLEILITKAPTTERAELKPWLHTVIKHEALALRRQRERLLDPDASAPASAALSPGPDEGVGERERARHTEEALRQLKQSELHCLLLKALGYSYDEIALRTGFSWTKVNRSLTEGRRRFFDRFAQIQSGEHCERFRPLLSAASDGEVRRPRDENATPAQEHELKEHLERCHSCRAVLRGYRSVPGRLAQLLPPAAVLPALERGGLWSRLHDAIVGGAGDRTAALGVKLQQAGELVTTQKAATQKAVAVVASSAAIAGGAAVQEHALDRHRHQSGSLSQSVGAERPPTDRTATVPEQVQPPPPEHSASPTESGAGSTGKAAPETDGGEFDLGPSSQSPDPGTTTSVNPEKAAEKAASKTVSDPVPSAPGAVPPAAAARPASNTARSAGGNEFGP